MPEAPDARAPRWFDLLVWASGLAGMALVLAVTLPVTGPQGVVLLHGAWDARVDGVDRTLTLPGTFRGQGSSSQ